MSDVFAVLPSAAAGPHVIYSRRRVLPGWKNVCQQPPNRDRHKVNKQQVKHLSINTSYYCQYPKLAFQTPPAPCLSLSIRTLALLSTNARIKSNEQRPISLTETSILCLDNARSQTCISYELYDSLLSQRPDSADFQRSIASNQRIRHPNIDGHYLTVVDIILILLGLVGFGLVVDRFSCFLVPGLPSASLLRYIARPHLVHDLLRFVLSTAPAQARPVADLLVSFSSACLLSSAISRSPLAFVYVFLLSYICRYALARSRTAPCLLDTFCFYCYSEL